MATIILDAGHGGKDNGASYDGRFEKDDALALTLSVGEYLQNEGVNVMYTRTDDTYQSPVEKAMIGNRSGADYFISIHRNASEPPNRFDGGQVLIYDNGSKAYLLAKNIQDEMVKFGFADKGIIERKDLAVLRRTKMPAVLIEAGFITSDKDNALFDEKFKELTKAISIGILNTLSTESTTNYTETSSVILGEPKDMEESDETIYKDAYEHPLRYCNCCNERTYQVQVGAFKDYKNAANLLQTLLSQSYPAMIIYEDGLYKVRVGSYAVLDHAVMMERKLRLSGYDTYITT